MSKQPSAVIGLALGEGYQLQFFEGDIPANPLLVAAFSKAADPLGFAHWSPTDALKAARRIGSPVRVDMRFWIGERPTGEGFIAREVRTGLCVIQLELTGLPQPMRIALPDELVGNLRIKFSRFAGRHLSGTKP